MKKLIALILSCVTFCTSMGFSAYAADAETVSATLIADTYVDCRNNPAVNYGDALVFNVGRLSNTTYGLLKFSLPAIPEGKSVESAVLKLHNRYDPAHAGVEISVSRLSSDSWEEGAIVGNDVYSARTQNGTIKFPAEGTEKIKTVYPDNSVKYGAVELDATAIIQADYDSKNSMTSLAVSVDVDQHNGANLKDWTIWAKEGNATYAPKLEIKLCDAVEKPEEPEVIMPLAATLMADTYVDCRNNPTVNYGGEATFSVRRAGYNSYGLLKFALPVLPADKGVKSAVLKLYNRNDPVHSGVEISVSRLSTDTWEEGTIVGSDVYSARTPNGTIKFPAEGTEKIQTVYPDNSVKAGAVELDATAIIKNDYKNKNSVTSLAVSIDVDQYNGANIKDWVIWAEEGNAAYAPALEITLGEVEYEETEAEASCVEHGFTRGGNYSQNVQMGDYITLTKEQREGYIKFNIPELGENMTVIGASLYAVMAAKEDMSDNILSVYAVDNTWKCDEITWDNAPKAEKLVCNEHTFIDVNNGKDKGTSFDVTDYVQERLYSDNNGTISFKFVSNYKTTIEGGNDNVGIYGMSAAETRIPRLTLKVTNNPAVINVVKDKAAIKLPEVAYSDIVLPVEGANGSTIEWASDDETVINTAGAVTRGNEDRTVVLTATVTSGAVSYTKAFSVNVPRILPEGGEVIFYNTADAEITQLGDEATVYAKVRYKAEQTGVDNVIIARYDKDMDLMTAYVKEVSATNGEEVEFVTDAINSSRASYISIYVWNSTTGMKPILKNIKIIAK